MINVNTPIRLVQAGLAVVALGLNSYVTSWYHAHTVNSNAPPSVLFMLSVGVLSLLVLPYLFFNPALSQTHHGKSSGRFFNKHCARARRIPHDPMVRGICRFGRFSAQVAALRWTCLPGHGGRKRSWCDFMAHIPRHHDTSPPPHHPHPHWLRRQGRHDQPRDLGWRSCKQQERRQRLNVTFILDYYFQDRRCISQKVRVCFPSSGIGLNEWMDRWIDGWIWSNGWTGD